MDKIVICEKCGAMVKILIDCTCENCGIKCCGETMKEISAEEANKILKCFSPTQGLSLIP